MEKKYSKPSSTIKIKINHKERPYKEEPIIRDWQIASQETSATSSDEIDEGDEFEWVLPKQEKKEQKKIHIIYANESKKRKSKSKKRTFRKNYSTPQFKGIFYPIVLAVTIGLFIGIFILNMLNSEEVGQRAEENPSLNDSRSNESEDELVESVVWTQPSWDIAVIQAGVFSTEEAAETRANELKKEGQSTTIIPIDNRYYVFIGITKSLDTAKDWEKQLKDLGIGQGDLWAKEITLDEKQFTFSTEDEKQLFSKEIEYLQEIAEQIASGIVYGQFDQKVLDEALPLNEELETSFEGNPAIKQLHDKLLTAINHMKSINNMNEQKKDLYETQQYLLDFITIYMGIRNETS